MDAANARYHFGRKGGPNEQSGKARAAAAVTQPVPYDGRAVAEQYGPALGIQEEGYRTETGTPVVPAAPRGRRSA